MSKQEYLYALEKELRKLPKAELTKVLEYYSEYFDEAGLENEQSAIEELGDPKNVASQVLTDTAIKSIEEPVKTIKGGLNTIWIILLAIFASPIALPLIFAGVLVILALAFTGFMLFLSIALVSVVCIAAGFSSIIVGFVLLFSQFASALAIMGTGSVALALGILAGFASVYVGKWIFALIVRLFRKMVKRGAAQ